MSEQLLVVSSVSRLFGGLRALSNLDLTVAPREIVGLIGPNGAGKTTAFNVISGAIAPSDGTVTFDGHRIDNLPLHKVARLGLVRTYQATTLFLDATVAENAMYAALGSLPPMRLIKGFETKAERRASEEARERADAMLRRVGLGHLLAMRAGGLPYGDQRRLGVAIALINKPKLLLVDEPAAGLNMGDVARLRELISQINAELSVAVLLIEHNMKLVMSVCSRIAVLHHGSKIADGTPERVRADPAVVTAYLGALGETSA